jgi:hypothetical protein
MVISSNETERLGKKEWVKLPDSLEAFQKKDLDTQVARLCVFATSKGLSVS